MDKISKEYRYINGLHCFNTSALCSILNISRTTLSDWADSGCPKVGRGWWSIEQILRWRGLVGSGIKTADDIEKLSLNEQKLYYETQLKQAQYEATDIKNAIARGDYLKKSDVIFELQSFFVVFKKSLQGLPRKMSAEIAHFIGITEARRLESKISEFIRGALEQLSIEGVYSAKGKKK